MALPPNCVYYPTEICSYFCFLCQVQAEAEAEAVDGDSLPLSPEELELLEEVEKVKEEVEEKVAEVEEIAKGPLPFSYSGIKKRETYVNKYVIS